MVRRMTHRLLAGGALAVLASAYVALGAAPAAADGPELITIEGEYLDEPLAVDVAHDPELFAALHKEVGWLSGKSGQAPKPDADSLGPQYTVVIQVDGKPRHTYDLYPLADGGPRAYRPAEQPGKRKVSASWFYARLTLPDTLREIGVPLPGGRPNNGTGGGGAAPQQPPPPGPGVLEVMDEWRESVIRIGAGAIAMMVGLAGVALLIRRRV